MTRRLDNRSPAQAGADTAWRHDSIPTRHMRLSPPANLSVIGLASALLLAMAFIAAFAPSPVRASSVDSAVGAQLYEQHCAACHQAGGQGIDGAFPPLAGNPAAADGPYVETVIREGVSGPIEVNGVSYDAVMPPVGALTDPAEVAAVVSHVVGLAAPADTDQDAEPSADDQTDDESESPPAVGDIERGRRFFIGAMQFENGGAACAACHTAGSVGNLGGQGLGPSLTDTFQTLGGEAGLTSWMSNPPSPTMQPLFADRPLNESELADIVAFLGDAPSQDEPDSQFDRLTVAAIAGLLVLIAGMAVAWRGMRQTYVERLRAKPNRNGSGANRRRQQAETSMTSNPEKAAERRRLSAQGQRSGR